jgi:hypothetical protein
MDSELRQDAVMPDRYRAPGGWTVEVVQLSLTPDRRDGTWIRVPLHGFFVADIRTVAELAQWIELAELEEALTPASSRVRGTRQTTPGTRGSKQRIECRGRSGRSGSGPVAIASATTQPTTVQPRKTFATATEPRLDASCCRATIVGSI